MEPDRKYNKGDRFREHINDQASHDISIRGFYYDRWKYKEWIYFVNEHGGSYKESQFEKMDKLPTP